MRRRAPKDFIGQHSDHAERLRRLELRGAGGSFTVTHTFSLSAAIVAGMEIAPHVERVGVTGVAEAKTLINWDFWLQHGSCDVAFKLNTATDLGAAGSNPDRALADQDDLRPVIVSASDDARILSVYFTILTTPGG